MKQPTEIKIEKAKSEAKKNTEQLDKDVESEVEKKPEKKHEIWVSLSARQHSILLGDGFHLDPKTGHKIADSIMVTFKDYKLELDLSDPQQKHISDLLRKSPRYGRDVFLVGDPLASHDVKARTELFKQLSEMNIEQLRALLSTEEIFNAGVPVNTDNPQDLVAVVMNTKSIGVA